MSEKYRFVRHTADIEFIAYGKTMEELLGNALLAMFSTIADIKGLQRSRHRACSFSISVKAKDDVELLWLALQGSLSKAEADGLFAYRVDRMSYKEAAGVRSLRARCRAKRKMQELGRFDVKGVSLFDMRIKRGRRLSASVVLDV